MTQLQATVLKALLDKDNWEYLGSMVNHDSFNDANAKSIFSIIGKLHETTNGNITVTDIRLYVEATFKVNTNARDDIIISVGAIEAARVPDDGVLRDLFHKFVSRNIFLKAAQLIATNIDSEDFDPGEVLSMVSTAAEVSSAKDTSVIDFAKAGPPSDDIRTGITPIGVHPDLDAALDGGTGNGELTIFLAPSGVGKTSFLLNCSSNAAQLGRNVLHVTLEINGRKCVTRVDQQLTGMTKSELITNPFPAMAKRKSLVGNLWFRDYSHTRTTVADIRNLILSINRNNTDKINYLVIDYMELISPEFFNRNNPRFNYSAVAKDLRAVANEFDINIITAWQTNRYGSSKEVLSKEDVGEDWGVVKIADIIVGLNQNMEELRQKIMRVNILKQRESTRRGIYYLHCDLDRMVIRQAEGSDPIEDEGTESFNALGTT